MALFTNRPLLETVTATKYQAFEFHRFSKPTFDFIWHHHPEIELTYIIRGHGVRYIGNSIQPFHAGDLCLIGPNVPHAYGSHPHMREGAEWLVLHFLPERLGAEFWKLPNTRELLKLLETSQRGWQFLGKRKEACLQLMKGLHRGKSSLEGLTNFLRVLAALNLIEKQIPLNPLNARGSGTPLPDRRLQKVLAWMESTETTHLTQKQASHLIGMSPASFSRFFRVQTDRTFVRHLNELRVARACVSLAVGGGRIAEIAMESGFENLSNFNRQFKQIMGLSPRDYKASFPV